MSLKVTYLGHSSFHVTTAKNSFFIDPFVTPNPLAANIQLDDYKADHIYVTHAHQDHIADVPAIAKSTGATIVSNYEIVQKFAESDLAGHPMNFGGILTTDYGRIKSVSALHSSSFPDGSYGGCPGGFVFMLQEASFYFAGDTSLFSDMSLIPQLCGAIDFAILPIGGNFTMDAVEAVAAAKLVGTTKVIGCHYDTFGYIKINHDEARNSFNEAGIQLLLPSIGESLEF